MHLTCSREGKMRDPGNEGAEKELSPRASSIWYWELVKTTILEQDPPLGEEGGFSKTPPIFEH